MNRKEEKFKQLIAEQHERILSICRHYAGPGDSCKDLYQEVLINIWKSFDSFRGESAISTWIYRIALNTALSYSAKEFKRMNFNLSLENTKIPVMLDDSADNAQLKESQLDALHVEINNLSVIDKLLVSLMLENLSTREMADIIGITEPNVRTKLTRIRENLRQTLNTNDHGK